MPLWGGGLGEPGLGEHGPGGQVDYAAIHKAVEFQGQALHLVLYEEDQIEIYHLIGGNGHDNFLGAGFVRHPRAETEELSLTAHRVDEGKRFFADLINLSNTFAKKDEKGGVFVVE